MPAPLFRSRSPAPLRPNCDLLSLNDQVWKPYIARSELVQRLLADTCELCGGTEQIQVHHIRHLRDLKQPGRAERPLWVQVMAARRRKTLVVCHECHTGIHTGMPRRRKARKDTGEPDDVKASRPVRRGADGKVPTM